MFNLCGRTTTEEEAGRAYAAFNPEVLLHRLVLPEGVQQVWVIDGLFSAATFQPGPQVKKEQMWEKEEGQQQETDIIAVVVKGEEEEEKPLISELHWRQTVDNIKEERPISIKEEPSTEVINTQTDGDKREEQAFGCDEDRNGEIGFHQTSWKPFSCDVCGESCSRKNALKKHKLKHTRENPSGCDTIKKFPSKKTFKSLKNWKLGLTKENPYFCDICDKYVSDLNRHMRSHTGERPYCCIICSLSFRQKTHLVHHIRTHTGEKPYGCNICKRCFTRKWSLEQHMKRHSPYDIFKALFK